jgi:hypothetical protein
MSYIPGCPWYKKEGMKDDHVISGLIDITEILEMKIIKKLAKYWFN